VGEVGRPQWAERRRCWSALADRTNRWGRDGCASGPRRTLVGVVVRCDQEELRALPGGAVLRRTRTPRSDQGDLVATSIYLGWTPDSYRRKVLQ
jgi:hypothetical protein